MHQHFQPSYSHISSPLHRLPAAVKMMVAVTIIVVLVTVPPSPILFTLAGLLLILLAAASNVPGLYIVKRMLFLEPFVLGVAVLTLFGPNGRWMFLLVVVRTTLCILTVVLLANTTRFSDMLVVLRKLRVPALIITTLALMDRYLYVLKDETERMRAPRVPHFQPQPRQNVAAVGNSHCPFVCALQRTGRTHLRGDVRQGMAMTPSTPTTTPFTPSPPYPASTSIFCPPALEVKNLYYHYGDGTEALRGLSFAIAPGECVGLIGPNGAGKSTLLLHLNGILPDEHAALGDVLIDGEKIAKENLEAIRRKVGFVFQDADDQLFCASVAEDVAFGPQQFGMPKDQLEQIVRDALAKVGLPGFENRPPHHLSGGEKRRVCLAGVLACQPGILVLDEPTSNLDPRGRREFKALLRQIPATKIIATHDLELVVDMCTRTIVIDHGQIVADGPTVELLSNEKLMLEHGLEVPHILTHRHPHG